MMIITLTEAKQLLTNMPHSVKIELEKLPGGVILVTTTKTKQDILNEKYANLIGQQITVTEASEKYNVHRDTIIEWKKNGYITVLKPGYRMELDEAETAYCADIYHARGRRSGVPLLDKNGLPYQLKHPKLSKRRRNSK